MLWYENFMLYICTLSVRCFVHIIIYLLYQIEKKIHAFAFEIIDYNLISTNTSVITFIYIFIYIYLFIWLFSMSLDIHANLYGCLEVWVSLSIQVHGGVNYTYISFVCSFSSKIRNPRVAFFKCLFVFEQVVFQCDRWCKVPHIWYMVANRNRWFHGISVTAYFIILITHRRINILLQS